MSSQERNQHALQRLMKWIAPRLYENEPDSENSERAMRALSGQLGSNPPFVIDAFDLGVSPRAWIEHVAISPKGKVAIVVGEPGEVDGSSTMLLTTWPRSSGYSEFQTVATRAEDPAAFVLFPEGSDTPAVLIGGEKLVWGNWTLELPWKEEQMVPPGACLTLWEDKDHYQHVAYIDEYIGEARVVYKMNVIGAYSKPSVNDVRWLGRIDGSLAWIVNEVQDGKCETLYWRSVEAIMLRGERIITKSIGFVDGGIQFVTGERGRMFAHRVKGNDPNDDLISDPMEVCLWGDGHIFGYNKSSPVLYEFSAQGEWVQIAEMEKGQLAIQEGVNVSVFDFGDHVVFADTLSPKASRIIDVYPNHPAKITPIVHGPQTGFLRAHDGLVYQTVITGEGGFIWNALNNVPGKRPLTAVFPLYNRFYTLTPVHDDRGKAIMGWGYAEGTFAIIRYPLPTR